MVNIRHTFVLVLISILFLTACTTPIAQTLDLPAPTGTSAPAPAKPVTQPTGTIEPVQEPSPTPTVELTESPAPVLDAHWVALTGQDGIIRLVDRDSGHLLDVTSDATRLNENAGEPSIRYWSPTWSSDGQMLAYLRIDSAKANGIWDIDVDSGESVELVQPENREI
jgi:hypothetical protein